MAEGEAGAAQGKLVSIKLDEASIGRGSPDIEQERAVAIYDLIEENRFCPIGATDDAGPDYALTLSIADRKLVFDIDRPDGERLVSHILSLSPFRRIVKDYHMICDSYYQAIRTQSPSQIEAIDMGRRGLHNEGAELLKERLKDKVEIDHATSRRLFTLVCVLHWKG